MTELRQTTTAAQPDDAARAADLAAIRDVVATVEHTQQHELVDEFLELFRADAIWTTGHGRRLFGRDEISAFARQVLPGAMANLRGWYEVVHVLFIRPDVAAVKVRQRYTRPDGEPIEGESEGSPLYVMAKEDGHWRLVACQNTGVIDE
ncbi:SgcJ/EcaC family oxidoreductase [Frankia sp. CNm7]|uniref:SgcJ/EcaC family oxidoreductase n=1 Tax=Frankia nepalensis TaxID=1836974 RepID=A0A937RGR0_9ACTN|nr:SgcJ/EcaC family oxidoreductase [Frankia nepalensis]MBL7497129.1 SgcJ/EcaC family oxidoreductase [Frankia nepalensis]MBL7509512.1 SgcJ/EcaC family oxidoreductase [Frankia nepalensis]MBL7517451.1 SgcJ/EcaC family oxidoreductase [Frankia nepalensis]MBL7627069.1 SgcJ/EcaC family oxidoreductase [Frankia nepalensis]